MNSSFPIINTKIVNNIYDAYWQDISPYVANKSPRSVLVLVNTLPKNGNEETLLIKMLEGCKLSPVQYNIVQIDTGVMVPWHQLRESLQPKVVFLLGIHPNHIGISAMFCLCLPNKFNDCIWIPAPGLNELENNKETKKYLWENAMKPIFINQQFGNI